MDLPQPHPDPREPQPDEQPAADESNVSDDTPGTHPHGPTIVIDEEPLRDDFDPQPAPAQRPLKAPRQSAPSPSSIGRDP
jgi:hypothetical protein